MDKNQSHILFILQSKIDPYLFLNQPVGPPVKSGSSEEHYLPLIFKGVFFGPIRRKYIIYSDFSFVYISYIISESSGMWPLKFRGRTIAPNILNSSESMI